MTTTVARVVPWPQPVHGVPPIAAALDTLALWRRRYRDRCRMLALDDRLLRDIGVTRADALREGTKPFLAAVVGRV
jgi:uncharacterized protein YjiS (DUF1127 family)